MILSGQIDEWMMKETGAKNGAHENGMPEDYFSCTDARQIKDIVNIWSDIEFFSSEVENGINAKHKYDEMILKSPRVKFSSEDKFQS